MILISLLKGEILIYWLFLVKSIKQISYYVKNTRFIKINYKLISIKIDLYFQLNICTIYIF